MKAIKGAKLSFEAYMRAVDAAVESKAGVSVYDLPDVDFVSMYKLGLSPAAAARNAIKSAKGDDMEF